MYLFLKTGFGTGAHILATRGSSKVRVQAGVGGMALVIKSTVTVRGSEFELQHPCESMALRVCDPRHWKTETGRFQEFIGQLV